MKKVNIGGWGKNIKESLGNWQKQLKKWKLCSSQTGYLLFITVVMAFCFFCWAFIKNVEKNVVLLFFLMADIIWFLGVFFPLFAH